MSFSVSSYIFPSSRIIEVHVFLARRDLRSFCKRAGTGTCKGAYLSSAHQAPKMNRALHASTLLPGVTLTSSFLGIDSNSWSQPKNNMVNFVSGGYRVTCCRATILRWRWKMLSHRWPTAALLKGPAALITNGGGSDRVACKP